MGKKKKGNSQVFFLMGEAVLPMPMLPLKSNRSELGDWSMPRATSGRIR